MRKLCDFLRPHFIFYLCKIVNINNTLLSVRCLFRNIKKNFVYSYSWFIYRARTNFFALVLFLKIAICKDKSSCSVL